MRTRRQFLKLAMKVGALLGVTAAAPGVALSAVKKNNIPDGVARVRLPKGVDPKWFFTSNPKGDNRIKDWFVSPHKEMTATEIIQRKDDCASRLAEEFADFKYDR